MEANPKTSSQTFREKKKNFPEMTKKKNRTFFGSKKEKLKTRVWAAFVRENKRKKKKSLSTS